MKEAKKYVNHHKVRIQDGWYIPVIRAKEAVEIAYEEGRVSFRNEVKKK